MRTRGLARKIDGFLARNWNVAVEWAHPVFNAQASFWAGARAEGRRILVVYGNGMGEQSITRGEAQRYLEFLEAGGVGTHVEAWNRFRKQKRTRRQSKRGSRR